MKGTDETRAERVLVLVGRPDLRRDQISLLRELSQAGAEVVAWHHPPILQDRFPSPDVAGRLGEHDVSCRTLTAVLGERESADIEDVVIAWVKSLGKSRLGPSGNFRETFRYRELSLWWWAELFVYHETPLRLYVRDIEALWRLVERKHPTRLVVVQPVRELAQVAKTARLPLEVHGEDGRRFRRKPGTTWHSLAMLTKMWGTGLKSLLRRGRGPASEPPRFLFLTHASMWRERRRADESSELFEMYFDPLLRALAEEDERFKSVAVGPSVPYQRRTVWAALGEFFDWGNKKLPYVNISDYFRPAMVPTLTRAHFDCWRDWRRFRKLAQDGEGFEHRGFRVDAVALDAFRDTFLLQLPWAIRAYHEILCVLERESPNVLLLYAESSGLGRAAIAAACHQRVPTFAVQHGVMYPQYFAYEHTADETGTPADGKGACPLPTRTAVFGSLARDLLIERGHYPPESVVVTGSPKFDALLEAAARYERADIRKRYAVPATAFLIVIASRFSAIGPVFREVVRAVESDPSIQVLVKPHQAERPDRYHEVIEEEGASRIGLVHGDDSLIELLVASDGLLTVDSLASSEALVLGRPVLVVNMPNHLESLVERGVALGAGGGEEIAEQIKRFVHDIGVQEELQERRRKYIQEFASGADGLSTGRVLAALRETAKAGIDKGT